MLRREWTLAELKEILPVGLKYHRDQVAGSFVLDDYDQHLEGARILTASVEENLKRGNVKTLKKTLEYLMHLFACEDPYGFGDYLFEKTGYRLTPIDLEHQSRHPYHKLHLSVSGEKDFALTTLQILLRDGSGVIYCIRGSYHNLKARWADEHTIEIEIPGPGEEFTKVYKVTTKTEVYQIVYKEN